MNPRQEVKIPLAIRQAIDRLTYSQCLKIVRFADGVHPYTKGTTRDYLFDTLRRTRDSLSEKELTNLSSRIGWPDEESDQQEYATLFLFPDLPKLPSQRKASIPQPPRKLGRPRIRPIPPPKPPSRPPEMTDKQRLALTILQEIHHH